MSENENMSAGLEETAAETKAVEQPTEKKAKKELTAEEIANVRSAAGIILGLGVSENFAKLVKLAGEWNDKPNQDAAKKECIEAFGGSEKLKDYIGSDEFAADVAAISGLVKLSTTVNTIKSFYARREGSGGSRAKKQLSPVRIGGETYNVSTAYLKEIAALPKDEKRKALLEHPDTVKIGSIEEL